MKMTNKNEDYKISTVNYYLKPRNMNSIKDTDFIFSSFSS